MYSNKSVTSVERIVNRGLGWNRMVSVLGGAVIEQGSNCGRYIKVQTTSGVYVVNDGAHNIYMMIEDV